MPEPTDEELQALEAERQTCPKCGSQDVRRSHAESIVASLFRMFGKWPYRCRSCRARFYRSTPPPENS